MYISHLVTEGQRHNNPLNRVAFVYNGPKGMELLLIHVIVEVAEVLGGSFKLVTLATSCKGDDSTAQGNTKEWGHKQIKKHK